MAHSSLAEYAQANSEMVPPSVRPSWREMFVRDLATTLLSLTALSNNDKYKCEHCQKHKLSGRGYGLLPEREMRVAPWTEVAVDLIGPWKVKVSGCVVEFNALTCIDTASNLVELIRIDKKSSPHVTHKFEQAWLARYP